MSRNLIVTIDSHYASRWAHITSPRLYSYAETVNADLWVITGPVFGEMLDATSGGNANPSAWKIPLTKWFAHQSLYRRMLFVDADIFIPARAGNVFEECQEDGVWMAEDMTAEANAAPWREWAQQCYPGTILPDDWIYRNNGVFLTDAGSALVLSDLYGKFPDLHTRWVEQDLANIVVSISGLGKMMPGKYNHPCPWKTLNYSEGDFIHTCGCSNVDRHLWFERMEQAEKLGLTKLRKL